MVSTKDKEAFILAHNETKKPQYFTNNYWSNSNLSKQHLYVLSDEKLKKDDYFYDPFSKKIYQITKNHVDIFKTYGLPEHWKKIIATTNRSLKTTIPRHNDFDSEYYIPQLSQDFIKEYCKRGGVNEIEVEYERRYKHEGVSVHDWGQLWDDKIKINSNNTVNASFIEEEMYTREEVINLLHQIIDDLGAVDDDLGSTESYEIKNWIKENLK